MIAKSNDTGESFPRSGQVQFSMKKIEEWSPPAMKRKSKGMAMRTRMPENSSMKANFKNVLGKAEETLARIYTANAATLNKAASACFTKKV